MPYTRRKGMMRFGLLLFIGILGISSAALVGPSPVDLEARKLEEIVQTFKEQLGISERVLVQIVSKNERLASVQPSPQNKHVFILKMDREFLATLNDTERQAMVAHELGHVWIFTHHPYLQSEALANQKAEELVSRESLKHVYEKVWELDAEGKTLVEYLNTKFGIVNQEDSALQAIPSLSGTK